MTIPSKPTRVLCKRTSYSGKPFWWDEEKSPPQRHQRENRELIEGQWYDVIDNPHATWDEDKRSFWFSIIDSQGNPHAFAMYTQEDMASWPEFCTNYGPRDYAKWFYTPEELKQLEEGTFKLIEDISIFPGRTYWVKDKEGNWIVAQCMSKHATPGKFYWQVIGTSAQKTDWDFSEIGPEVTSPKEQRRQKRMAEASDNLLDEIVVLVDAINKNDPDQE